MTSASHSLRHAKIATNFADDLKLDPNVFIGFYQYARKKLFLEALNFFLEVRRTHQARSANFTLVSFS